MQTANVKVAHQNQGDDTRRLALVSNFLEKSQKYSALTPQVQAAVVKQVDERVKTLMADYHPGAHYKPRDIWEMAKAGLSHGIVAAGACAYAVFNFLPPVVSEVLRGEYINAAARVAGSLVLFASAVYVAVDVVRSGLKYAPLAGAVRREAKTAVDEHASRAA